MHANLLIFRLIVMAGTLLAAPALLAQPAPADPAAQLRDALRATTLQLRTAQGELAAAQAERDQARADFDQLKKRFDALEKQVAADRTAAQTNVTNLNTQLARKDSENARLADSLQRAQQAKDEGSRLAATREEARLAAEQKFLESERNVADLRRRNRNLFVIGSEVLARYENFGLGNAILAREPFTQLTRVKLQNEAQSYQDRLEQYRAKLPASTGDTQTPGRPAGS